MHVQLAFVLNWHEFSFIPAAEYNSFSTCIFLCLEGDSARCWTQAVVSWSQARCNMRGQLVTQRLQLSFRGNQCRSERSGGPVRTSLCIFMHWWFQSIFWNDDLKYPQVASHFKASRALKMFCIFVFLAGFPICMHLTKSLSFHKHTPCMQIYPNHFALKQAPWLLNYPFFQNKSVHLLLCASNMHVALGGVW